MQYPIDGIETDVQLSKDEVPVLWHDRFLSKIPGLEKFHIDDFNYSQLSVMDFAGHFGKNSNAEGIMLLQEFLASCRSRCRLLIEIKNREWELRDRHEIKVRQTLEMVGTTHADQIIVSSFGI